MREGADALIITTGITLRNGLEAADQLKGQGVEVAVVHVPTIKPFDEETIKRYAANVPVIVTVEEHSIVGGSVARWPRSSAKRTSLPQTV